MAAALLCAAGCMTPDNLMAPPSNRFSEDAGRIDASTAEKELAVAKRRIHAGEYATVLPRLHEVVTRYPGTEAALNARYFLGVVYYRINNYPDALDHFQGYLAQAPAGVYAEPSRAYVDILEQEVLERYATPAELEARLDRAQERATQNPDELAYQLELADSLWRTQRYEAAGAVYERVLSDWPDLAADMTIRTRVERNADGTVNVLTPREQVRQQAAKDPLVIFNTNGFRSGRDQIYSRSLRDIYYNVSGQIVNRSEDTVHDVRVMVTIYAFTGMVFEVQTAYIGAMRPEESRAFSVRFTNFDDINNVSRYECVATYTR
jgi:tetratricopeptide (TPR) repeat protein